MKTIKIKERKNYNFYGNIFKTFVYLKLNYQSRIHLIKHYLILF
jgi:hypothetical protein